MDPYKATLSIFYSQQIPTGIFLPCRRNKKKFPCWLMPEKMVQFWQIYTHLYTDQIKKIHIFPGMSEEKIKIKAGRLLFFLSDTISTRQRTHWQ